jgi:hypothetical protein
MNTADILTDIAENEQKIYDKGFSEALELGGYTGGFEAGKQAEYDAFWDSYQQNGNRTNYQYSFSGYGWNKTNFIPKHSMYPETINTGFWRFGFYDTDIESAVDFVEVFDKKGLVFDTSNCTNFMSAFIWAKIKRLGIIDARKDTQNLSSTFGYGEIQTIEKLIVCEDNGFANTTFQNQSALENITFEGVIAKSGLNLQWSTKLSKASIESIIGALECDVDWEEIFETQRPATSITLSLTAVNKAYETSEGANDGAESDEFINVCATPSTNNWTISLE